MNFFSLRYLRPSRDFELISTSQTLAFEEDCETSGGTSGDEFWGTPNSGGVSVASNEVKFTGNLFCQKFK